MSRKEGHHESYADAGGHKVRGIVKRAADKICPDVQSCIPIPEQCLMIRAHMRRCPRSGTGPK